MGSDEPRTTNTGRLQWLRGSLTRRVLGWMLLVSLLPLLIMAYQGYHCAGQALVEQTQRHLDSVATARGQLIEGWLNARRSGVAYLARSLKGSPSQSGHLLEPMLDEGFAWAARYGERGGALDLRARPGVEVDPLPRHIQDLLKKDGSALWESRGPDGRLYLNFAQALEGAAGYGAAGIDLAQSLDALLSSPFGLGRSGRLYAVSPDLTILSDPLSDNPPATRKADPSVRHLAMGHTTHADHGFFHLLPVAPEILRSAAPLNGTDYIVVAEADPREALAWLGILRIRAIATGLVTLVVLIFVTFWIARSLGRPLRELARVAQRVRGGRTEERLGPMRGTEAEDVRQAFNRMLDDLREKQRELVRTATLASVGELSSSIVHEMRNPLSSIKMNLQALRRRVGSDPNYGELAEIATEQVGRVEVMLDDLLKYGRPVELHAQPTSFRQLAESALAVVSDAARAKGVEIEVDDRLNGHRVDVDREQMCRALTNLLQNAVQAVPEGGRVRFVGRPADHNGDVALEVLDNGPGLSPEMRDRLFKPFFTTKPNGTGLGLANVKKIVDLHDGAVAAHNRPEGGAAFTVILASSS